MIILMAIHVKANCFFRIGNIINMIMVDVKARMEKKSNWVNKTASWTQRKIAKEKQKQTKKK